MAKMASSIKNVLEHLDKPTTVSVLLACLFGFIFVFYTPLLWGADETTHFGRVYQISDGHVISEKIKGGYGGQIPASARKLIYYVNDDITVHHKSVAPGIISVGDPKGYVKLVQLSLNGGKVDYIFSNTAPYSPIAYLPAVIGLKIAEILNLSLGLAIYAARSAGLVVFIVALGWAMWSLRTIKAKWMVFAVAFIPMALYQASIISADSFTNTASILLVALTLKGIFAKEDYTKVDIILLAACCLLLPVMKPTYLLLPILPLLLLFNSKFSHTKRNLRKIAIVSSVIAGLFIFALWQYATRSLVSAPKLEIIGLVPWWNSVDPHAQITYIVGHPLATIKTFLRTILIYDNRYFDGLFGWLGFNAVQIPGLSIMASFSALLLSVAASEKAVKRNLRGFIKILTVVSASIAILFGIFYLTISGVGMSTIEGVQGRYFIPLVLPTLLLVSYGTATRLNFREPNSYRKYEILMCTLVVFSLTLSVIKYVYFTWP